MRQLIKNNDQSFDLVLKINLHLFAPLVVISFGTLFIETIVYPGFLSNNIGITPNFFLILVTFSYCLLLFHKLFYKQTFTEATKWVLLANIVCLPFLIFVSAMLNQLEKNNYTNYVFSTFHIHLAMVEKIVIFSLFLALLYLVSFADMKMFRTLIVEKTLSSRQKKLLKNSKNTQKIYQELLGPILFLITILFLFVTQLYAVIKASTSDIAEIAQDPFASFEERRVQKFGGPYQTYAFIRRKTEERSVIAAPPQFTWGIVGNIGFSRYFLYPRFLIHPEDFTSNNMPEVDYYIIAESIDQGGGEYKIWPPYPIPAESIHLFTEMTRTEEVVEAEFYDPNDPIYKGKWGIIKVPEGTRLGHQ